MNPFMWFDKVAVEKVFEPIAWRIETRFGRNNFQLAHDMNNIGFAAVLVAQAWACFNNGEYWVAALGAFVCWSIWDSIRQGNDAVEKVLKKSFETMNPNRRPDRVFLRMALGWVLLPFYGLLVWNLGNGDVGISSLVVMFNVCVLCSLYFVACNPPPPKWKPAEPLPALPQQT